jgi:hypothetical protein
MNCLSCLPMGDWHVIHRRMRLAIKVSPEGCWHWTGEKNRNGYGRVRIGKRRIVAHRVMYVLTLGRIPDDLVLDHLCRNRDCVNPLHLEPVTVRENTLRGDAKLFAKTYEGTIVQSIE